ncbi:MAG: ABC transporter substrate-binding protein [Sulfurimonas sp.]
MKYLFTFLLFFVSIHAEQKSLEKVSLQLQWLDQFQFAGYYMAKEKGFYEDAGFDVDIKKFTHETDALGDVLSAKTTYAIGRSSLILYYAQGKSISLLSAAFQSSPLVLIALGSSGINSVKDFKDKTIMSTHDAIETASIYAMINASKTNQERIKLKKHTFDIEELIDKRVDLYVGYISNEPYILEQRALQYKLFSPRDKGFDFYSDILFTSQENADKNPQSVARFKKASIRGWEYAFNNIEEAVNIIYTKYNAKNKTRDALMFEAQELKKLAYVNGIDFGTIERNKIERILDVYKVIGLTETDVNLDNLIFSNKEKFLNKEDVNYLKQKGEISVCMDLSFLPYGAIRDGEVVGIASDVLGLTKESITIPYKFVITQNRKDSLKRVKERKCDMLPMALHSLKQDGVRYTTPYHHEHLVVVTSKEQSYILDINLVLDKEFAVVKDRAFIEDLKRRHPSIKLNYVDSLKDGFIAVEKKKYYGFIDEFVTIAYSFKNKPNGHLKVSGQLDESIDMGFGVRDDDIMLFNIFEKLSNKITDSDMRRIYNEWVSVNYIQKIKFKYLKEIIFLALIIIFIFFYRQHILKKKNSELEGLKDELLELNQTLELKIDDAVNEMQKKDTYLLHKSRLAQIGETVSMIGHQWKQPLSTISALNISIIMAIELEQYDLSDEKHREEFLDFLEKKLKKIELNTNNMGQIISDFSDFYKPNKHKEECTLNDPVFQVYWLLEGSLASEEIDLFLELASMNRVKLFKNEFVQVLVNIINNARDQYREKEIADAQICIKSYDRGDVAVMEISDNAGGIDEEIIDRIFDPYFSTKFDKNGTGLGLHMSKSIIKQHRDGKLYAENIQNGVKFTIEISKSEEENEK